MARRMSCSLTVDAVRARTKTVTRRDPKTWLNLMPGDPLVLVEKAMGLPKGARHVVLAEVTVRHNWVEPLHLIATETDYAIAELAAEGFPDAEPAEWAHWWAESHRIRYTTQTEFMAITCRRIEWEYQP